MLKGNNIFLKHIRLQNGQKLDWYYSLLADFIILKGADSMISEIEPWQSDTVHTVYLLNV